MMHRLENLGRGYRHHRNLRCLGPSAPSRRSAQTFRRMTDAEHWDSVYARKADDQLSWYEREPTTSLRLFIAATKGEHTSVIDVGAGTSPLATVLLETGWADVTVLDISAEALASTLANAPELRPTAVITDVRTWQPERTWNLWHDRAVFHFLVDPGDRERYLATATEAVAVGGAAIIGTFAADGPTQCSGLPAARYEANALADLFRPAFVLECSESDRHMTPGGVPQVFTWVTLRRI
jgi:SAM-dependent methyltransferase